MRSSKHQHFKTLHTAVFYLYINGLSNVYISWSGSQHGTYTSIESNFLLKEPLRLISGVSAQILKFNF